MTDFMQPIPSSKQAPGSAAHEPTTEAIDTALVALLMMAELHHKPADAAQLQHEFGQAPFSTQTFLLGAKFLGLSAKLVKQAPERLSAWPSR